MSTDCGNCPLRKRPPFTPLNDDQVRFMRKFKAGELRVEPGSQLLMQGSNSPQLFTVLRGLGVRQKTLENGRRQVINFVMPGDFIGLQAGVMGEMQHAVDSTTAMTLCVFNRNDLWDFFKAHPDLAFDLTWLAAIEEHFLGEALSVIGQLPGLQRIAWGLKRYHDRAVSLGLDTGGQVPFPFRQQDLADALGLSLVHTNKTLQKLRERQVLSLSEGALRLLDAGKLDALVDAETELPQVKRPLI